MVDLREVGHLAAWSVTSAKPGNGVELLRDGRADTFWQSDGLQPHLVNIEFQRKMQLLELHIHLDFKLDESYTPSKISVRAGSGVHDLKEVRVIELEEPTGWIRVPLGILPADAAAGAASPQSEAASAGAVPLRAFFLQLAVLANHQNGRDTHIREVKVYGPRADPTRALLGMPLGLTSSEMTMYATVR
mmetsp:Transcript_29147/g.74366  ORF Transcript_29147/g.74366 Transcript_29147/m.74366 type:complete len:189 (-) Transcript_29147:370-936(-)